MVSGPDEAAARTRVVFPAAERPSIAINRPRRAIGSPIAPFPRSRKTVPSASARLFLASAHPDGGVRTFPAPPDAAPPPGPGPRGGDPRRHRPRARADGERPRGGRNHDAEGSDLPGPPRERVAQGGPPPEAGDPVRRGGLGPRTGDRRPLRRDDLGRSPRHVGAVPAAPPEAAAPAVPPGGGGPGDRPRAPGLSHPLAPHDSWPSPLVRGGGPSARHGRGERDPGLVLGRGAPPRPQGGGRACGAVGRRGRGDDRCRRRVDPAGGEAGLPRGRVGAGRARPRGARGSPLGPGLGRHSPLRGRGASGRRGSGPHQRCRGAPLRGDASRGREERGRRDRDAHARGPHDHADEPHLHGPARGGLRRARRGHRPRGRGGGSRREDPGRPRARFRQVGRAVARAPAPRGRAQEPRLPHRPRGIPEVIPRVGARERGPRTPTRGGDRRRGRRGRARGRARPDA